MEELGHGFFVFVNAENERVAVLYRRNDGDYGLIEPTMGGGYSHGRDRHGRPSGSADQGRPGAGDMRPPGASRPAATPARQELGRCPPRGA